MSFIAAGVDAAGEVVGGIFGSNSAEDAAAAQAAATGKANKTLKKMYKAQVKDWQPWQQAGLGALGGMQSGDFQRDFTNADFVKDPGYDFRMREGQKALERSAAARGGLQAGGTLKALARYGQDYASNEFNNAYNRFNADRDRRFSRLSQLAGYGNAATANIANARQNYANQKSANLTGLGNAQAASAIAQGNAWSGMAQGLGNAAMDTASGMRQQNWMDKWLTQNQQGGPSNTNVPGYGRLMP